MGNQTDINSFYDLLEDERKMTSELSSRFGFVRLKVADKLFAIGFEIGRTLYDRCTDSAETTSRSYNVQLLSALEERRPAIDGATDRSTDKTLDAQRGKLANECFPSKWQNGRSMRFSR